MNDRMRRRSASVERAYRGDDFIELALRELRKYRQRYDLSRRALGFRTAPCLVTEVCETGLKMERERVVDRGADTPLFQEGLQIVAAGNAERVLIEDRDVARLHVWRLDVREIGEGSVIVRRVRAALRAPRL